MEKCNTWRPSEHIDSLCHVVLCAELCRWYNLTLTLTPPPPTQSDPTKIFAVYFVTGSDFISISFTTLSVTYILMLVFCMFMAYQIKQNITSFYNRYNDSPIVNLSSLLALTVSFGSIIASVSILPTSETVGFWLILLLLRDASWMFPMLGLMYLPMVSTSSSVCVCVCVRVCVCSVCACVCVHALCVARELGVWRGRRDRPSSLHVVWPLWWTVLCADL